jgi:hypothetical protein
MSVENHVNNVAHAQETSASSALSDTPTITTSPQSSAFASASQGNAFPAVIPPENRARTLILCFDGTGDQSVVHSSFFYFVIA